MPLLRSAKGRIVFTSSGASLRAYTSWGAYGASKAALNHLAMTLATEEPDITTISIRPGVVDTEMQRDIREIHQEHMDQKDREKFNGLYKTGQLLKPEQPGHVIAKLVLTGARELSGQFIRYSFKQILKTHIVLIECTRSWDDSKLNEY